MTICFDTDECLIKDGKPIRANVALLKVLSKTHKVFMWSGNGYEHAYEVAIKLRLTKYISGVLNKYATFVPDIAFDDKEIKLGKLDVKI